MLLPECHAVLSAQPDFLAQRGQTWLHEECTKLGMTCVFGVKFHPELAAIELFWGESKRFTRRRCDYKIESLRKTVPEALAFVGALGGGPEQVHRLGTIRRQFEHVMRYMDAYALNTLTPAQLEWTMHAYTSHRRITDCDEKKLAEEWLSPAFRSNMPAEIKADKGDVDDVAQPAAGV